MLKMRDNIFVLRTRHGHPRQHVIEACAPKRQCEHATSTSTPVRAEPAGVHGPPSVAAVHDLVTLVSFNSLFHCFLISLSGANLQNPLRFMHVK